MTVPAFGGFPFVPSDQTSRPKRQSHYRSYQAAMDSRIAQTEGGTVRFHLTLKDKVDCSDQEWVKLTDGREIRYPKSDEKILQSAREWMKTGKGLPPPLPQ